MKAVCLMGKRCLVCARNCNNVFKCLTHIKASIADRTFGCRYCCKSFKLKDDLSQHQRTHTGVRLYKCDDCNKSFTQNGIFKQHQQIHTGVRPYKCDDCDKLLTTKW